MPHILKAPRRRAPATGAFLAENVCDTFTNEMSKQQKADFLATISSEIPNQERLLTRVLSDVPGGLQFLVSLRADLLHIVREREPATVLDGKSLALLKLLDSNLKNAMADWFSEETLHLDRITMDSPDTVLNKVVRGEKVHPIETTEALQQRLGEGRRCFALFHPSLPFEPLCVVHVALLAEIARGMSEITGTEAAASRVHESDAKAAIFYSISSTQPGLSGVNLGNMLIKRAAGQLLEEFSVDGKLREFSTLSPIPSFRAWLKNSGSAAVSKMERSSVNKIISILEDTDGDNFDIESVSERILDVEGELLHLAAHYIVCEKKNSKIGRIACPVGNFHISNGAQAWRLNLLGDTSPKGIQNSLGTMINYRYDFDEIDARSEMYNKKGDIAQGEDFKSVASRHT